MFTGIVEACVEVRAFEPRGAGARLLLPRPGPVPAAGPEGAAEPFEAAIGDSIAVSGCCLTVAPAEAGEPAGAFAFDLSAETLARTWFGAGLRAGRRVNLERAARLSDRLGGHLVSGHVDGTATVVELREAGDGGLVLGFEVAPGLERYLVEKGSIALDGISLTVVEPRGRRFDVAVIPHTLAVTSLGAAEIGTEVHVEADQIGKWVERLVAPYADGATG